VQELLAGNTSKPVFSDMAAIIFPKNICKGQKISKAIFFLPSILPKTK
jgi:hypothetical protein